MIVYRNFRQAVPLKECTGRIKSLLSRIDGMSSSCYQNAVSLLMECGELETGVTDFLCPEKDEIFSTKIESCRELSMLAGLIVCRLWINEAIDLESLNEARRLLFKIESWKIKEILLSVPEGFVYYGLYPETYIEAARQFKEQMSPESVLVIGLRSIGTTLSALVSAQLKLLGCKVKPFTLRPRGHPFSRGIQIDSAAEEFLRRAGSCSVVVVDEGPGLSGSSLTGTLEKLSGLGFGEERTVVFPSWIPDGSRFLNESARELWPRYRKFTGEFDNLWVDSGRLASGFGMEIAQNLSAGMWRPHFIEDASFPAVHPHHERRKFLLKSDSKKCFLAKFVGLGRYGEYLVQRARRLAEGGFGPQVKELSNGFLLMKVIDGKPMSIPVPGDDFLGRAAQYCAFIRNKFPSKLTVTLDSMQEMIIGNVRAGVGEKWGRNAEAACGVSPDIYESEPVAVDGRMMPHEWIRTNGGYFKVDHLEHHCDQFFHGSQNIVWDIAGLCIEFRLSSGEVEELIKRYVELSGDKDIRMRLPFFRIAYLAFRIGYVSLAADSLSGDQDGRRFELLRDFYREELKKSLMAY